VPASLFTSPHPATTCDAVFLPWLKGVGAAAWRSGLPTVVVVPCRSAAYFLKARALAAGVGVLGVHFLTPGEVRDRLAARLGRTARVPLREHLHLLLATAAEGQGATSVAAAPDHLLKALDLLSAGGWSFAEAGPAALRPVVAEFETLLGRAGFQMMHSASRALHAAARTAPPQFAALFITGFDALHWPHWPLLAAATHAAQHATVCLAEPRAEAESLDAAWIGTWEQDFGAAEPVPADDEAWPFVEVLRLPESREAAAQRQREPAACVEFLVGENTAEQAQAVVAKALGFLADPACARLGILFPAAGALSRRVAALLAARTVPHNDGLAHHAPGALEDEAWPAWLELQENPHLPALLRFLRAQPERTFAGLPFDAAADALQRIFTDLLIDDLAVTAEYLERHPRKRSAPALAAALRALPFLPAQATLTAFASQTEEIFRASGWAGRADELARLATAWSAVPRLNVSRRTWLAWLRETLVSWRAEREAGGNHPYSRVHLLPCAQAESQAWTHLILAGLNEGQWPPAIEDSGFLGEDEIAALNRQVRGLNERAVTQGRQGEGHETVRAGHALCLGPVQRRELALRQFLNTLESATVAVAACAQLIDDAAPERRSNPSDFFTRLYFCARGRAVSQEAMSALRAETVRWLATAGCTTAPALTPTPATRRAFDTRRDRTQPFGEYEFALRAPPANPVRLAATAWESALAAPALVWMQNRLGIAASATVDETPWSLAAGQWVHQWLRAISDAVPPECFALRPPPAELLARVRAHAVAQRERVRATLAACARTAPDWWLSAWQQALHLAEQLAQRVAAVADRTHLATEWNLPDTAIPLDDGALLHVKGRIDLLLTNAPAPTAAWIVDYKTGHRGALAARKLPAGDGLQLALYALALRASGVSLLTPDLDLAAPQLTLGDLTARTRLWRGLHRLQETGIFGLRGALRDEFSFRRDYPLATLAIDPDLLEEKWALTHPDLIEEDDA